MSTGRFSGKVCYLSPDGSFGEIASPGMAPVAVDGAALRRVNADAIGTVVDFEHGVRADGSGGAVDITRRGKS